MAEKKKLKKTKRKQNRVTVLCAVLCFAVLLTFGDRCLMVMQVCSDIRKAEARLCEVNTERMSKVLIDEFRSGKLGKFTLEMPEENV